MTTYYVATLAKYVLINAADETEARAKGLPALREIYDRWPKHLPIEIRVVRPATEDEIDLTPVSA